MYNTHPQFHRQRDDPSASVCLAACLEHSAGQQNTAKLLFGEI